VSVLDCNLAATPQASASIDLAGRNAPAPAAPALAALQASCVLSEKVLQDLVVEGLLSHQSIEPPVFVFERFQPRRLARLQPTVLLRPYLITVSSILFMGRRMKQIIPTFKPVGLCP